jgi:hypothetical protein
MTGFWAKFAHGVAIAGQLANINHVLIPAIAGPYVTVGLTIAQMIIGLRQHQTNPDGTAATTAYKPPQQ